MLAQRREAQEQQRAEQEKAARHARIVELWSRSGVDERHRREKLADLQRHPQWAIAYTRACQVVDRRAMLVLLGDRGNGKTQLAVELIRRACREHQQSCLYLRMRQLGMRLRHSYDDKGGGEEQMFEKFVQPHLLVIDELQTMRRTQTEFERESLTLLMDMRYGAVKPTVLIANLDDDGFAGLVDASIIDRLRHEGGRITFDWPSFRGNP